VSVLAALAARARDAAAGADAVALAAAGRHVLDTTACMVSGASHPLTQRWLPLLPPEPAGVGAAGVPGRWGLATAVEIESTLAHLDEFDPLHGPAAVAPGAVVVPAALQVGAARCAPGEQVARAVVAGYEAVVEASLRFGGPALYASGWWPTALFGALGAAAATAVLLDLDASTTTAALGIAAAPLGGLISAGELGDVHYLLCGRAAAQGCWAARAAAAGITASATLLDAPAAAALGRAADAPSPSGPAHLAATAFKTWPCARPLHTALAALRELADAGVTPAPGDTVEIALPTAALRFITDQRRPTGPVDAAASAAVAVGGALAGRADDPGWYRDVAAGRVALPDVTVRLRPDPGLDEQFPARWGAEVAVHARDRASRRQVLVAPGDPDRPLGDDEVLAKAARLLRVSRSSPVLHRLLDLAAEPDVRALKWASAARA
jgi:2-methylcitrate dehydratase PrpD